MKKQGRIDGLPLFLVIIPFLSGGFYTFLSFPISLVLIIWLFRLAGRNGGLRFLFSDAFIAVTAIVLAYGLTAFWAVDKAMAWWGLVKYMPLVLFALLLMQKEQEELQNVYSMLPIAGVMMTLVSFALQFVKPLSGWFAPNGNLTGFLEYPNTYALFLLIGFVVLMTRGNLKKKDYLYAGILILGILLSGSRTTFLLLLIVGVVICIVRKEWRLPVWIGAALLVTILVSGIIQKLIPAQTSAGYLSTGTDSSTLLVRLLYFKDALKVIAKTPFGLGYMGYTNLRGSFQSGVYHVTYVHNELLQLLLDIGWVPVLLLIICLAKSFFAKNAGYRNRLIMFVILAHCMMDFDLQFLSIWFLLIPLMNFHKGPSIYLKKGKWGAVTVAGVVLAGLLWMCAGDFCYSFGWDDLCLRITPFHTSALMRQLPNETDTKRLEEIADQILSKNSHASLAFSAKANAAFADGDILGMMKYKKQAIKNNRYALEEYTDYFDKLYQAMQLYLKQGDTASAEICRQEILSIPQMLSAVKQETDPLAWKIQHTPELDLSQEYNAILDELQNQ